MSTSYDINGVNSVGGQTAYAPSTQPPNNDIQMFEQQIEALLAQMQGNGGGSGGGQSGAQVTGGQNSSVQALERVAEALLQALESRDGQRAGGAPPSDGGAPFSPEASAQPAASPGGGAPSGDLASGGPSGAPVSAATASGGTSSGTDAAAGSSPTAGVSSTSAGSGPNAIQITNTTDKPMTLGKFQNGQSTTDPSAQITLQPGQTGTINYQNGEAGFVAKADSSGTFQPNASRLEYEADADGKQKYPDVSYIDGRNASISLTDGAGLNKGDDKSIAANAPAGTVTTDSAGDPTIAGYYDGSTATMQAGANYMQSQLGTDGAYLHPNDDQLGAGSNPMSSTQSNTIYADFGNA
ncbi:hypothetical protein [Rhizosaccharibacter radicis]|uniref:Uncharacterized protein n=1 Tax=Rhizosaccharibacter radicis TaxID=2782605 RepID=A0ABT1VV94_9PROT|nr:hypothetical protein [Acetobacteraceae bacterium KSS12]